MTEILPGVLAHTKKELVYQLNSVRWAKKVQVDIMDGKFVNNKTINAHALAQAQAKQDLQIHYMGYKPEKEYKKYARLGAKEFIFHAESTKNTSELLEDIRLGGMRSGIAINPETPIRAIKDALIHADIILLLTVHPGFSGKRFLKTPLRKISQIKRINPLVQIGIDGGVNQNTIRLLNNADFVICSSAITTTQHPRKAYNTLKRML